MVDKATKVRWANAVFVSLTSSLAAKNFHKLSLFFLPQPWLHPRLWCSSCKSFSHRPGGFCWSRRQGLHISCFNCLSHFQFCSSRESFHRLCNTPSISPNGSFFKGFLRSLLFSANFHSALPSIGIHCIVFRFLCTAIDFNTGTLPMVFRSARTS